MAEDKENTDHHNEYIAVDDGVDFSDVGSSIETDITSLTSSIREHVYENGRRYHSLSAGAYVIPNDEPEQERLDMLHHTTSLILGGALHVTKLPENLHRVLDCGTGTGIWAINFADEHPNAQVIGVDLSPIQPTWIPPNCSFEVDDLEKPWLWKEPFDFIHSATLALGIRNWKQYIKNIYDHLTPGGVVEFLESRLDPTAYHCDDDSIPKDGYIRRFEKELKIGQRAAGFVDMTPLFESYLKDAGFDDIRLTVKKMPIGPWPKDRKKKEIGRWGLAIAEPGTKSYGFALFTRHRGMSAQDAEDLCENTFKEFCRRDVHAYVEQCFFTARKPPSNPDTE